jgi:hypothetical protein
VEGARALKASQETNYSFRRASHHGLVITILIMSIGNAIGLALLIIILKLLAPTVLTHGISTTNSFLQGAEVSAQVASSYAASAAALGRPAGPPFPLPQARQIRP